MNKRVVLTTIVLLVMSSAFCQNFLNTEKYKGAELFVVKKGYNVQQRLDEIKAIVGKEVTIYQISGKQNEIKLTYTGTAEMSNLPKSSDESKASLIIVKTKENGMMRTYFPSTNDNKYRIYLKEKME